jgi:hypothetical protein
MKITREVVKDLLPAYFSGEASADTQSLVEEYFREDPAFDGKLEVPRRHCKRLARSELRRSTQPLGKWR